MEYDLYDFDKTVYPHDSETVFLIQSMLTHPWLLFLAPYQAVCLCLFFLGFGDRFKGKCFCFLRFLNGEKLVKSFWKRQEKKLYPLFKPENRGYPTAVCSASPEYLIRPICEKYGVEVIIATKMDIRTGRIEGRNCKNDEKVNRLKAALPDAEFRRVLSDDLKSDIHIFRLGKTCFKARKGKLYEMSLSEIESEIGRR